MRPTGNLSISVPRRNGSKTESLASLFIGESIQCLAGALKAVMQNGTSRVYKQLIPHDKTFIRRNSGTELTMTWPMISKPNYLIPMIGQTYLKNQVQNILYLPPSIMMDSPYGQMKMQIKHGVLNGMRLKLVRKKICWVSCSKQFAKHRFGQACIIHCTNGSTHFGKAIRKNLQPIMYGRK